MSDTSANASFRTRQDNNVGKQNEAIIAPYVSRQIYRKWNKLF